MVQTVKFSQFATGGTLIAGQTTVGVSAGINAKFTTPPQFVPNFTTATRPDPATDGMVGYNTQIKQFEYYNGTLWATFSGTSDLAAFVARLAAYTAGDGASLVGLLNQTGVTNRTVQDLANAKFIVNTNNGSLSNAQSLSALSTGILRSTTTTGALSISAPLTSLDGLATLSNQMIYLSGPDTYAVIASATNSILATNNLGVPALTSTLPNAVQTNITKLGVQSQALDMGTHLINNLAEPTTGTDAATRNYVTNSISAISSNFLPLAAGASSPLTGDLYLNNHKIINVADPTNAHDVSTKAYTDTFLPLAAGIASPLTGILYAGNNQIKDVANPSSAQDVATKISVETLVAGYLSKLGGTMSGAIDMGNNQINNMLDPSSSLDAVNLQYLTSSLANYLLKSGGTMTGAINMGGKAITSLLDPVSPQDAATRNYVDLVATGFNVQGACYVATTANLTATYVNGASGIGATLTNSGALAAFAADGISPPTNARVLVWNQSSTLENGIYILTNQGSGAVAWVLTRAADYDQPSEIQAGDLVIINNGTDYGGSSFAETASVAAVGTDPILFSQFTFSATAVLLKANNLLDVANTVTAFNNISPLTTKGDLVGYSTQNTRLAVGGTDGQILQVNSGAATGLAWSTATYPTTTTVNQLLYSGTTNVVSGLSSLAGGVLVTDASSVPQFLANPGAAGRILQSGSSAIATWSTPTYPSISGASGKFLVSDGTNNVYSTSTIPTSAGATANKLLISDGTNYVLSTPTYPNAATSAGTLLRADGTNWVATTSTYPNTNTINTLLYASATNVMSALPTANSGVLVTSSAGVPEILPAGTTGQVLQASSAGTPAWSAPTFPTASGAAGTVLISDGTNYLVSTSLWPNTVGTSGKIVISDGTSNIYSTPTFPNAAGTSGNVLTSDGTNFVSAPPTGGTSSGGLSAINYLLMGA